MQLSSIEQAYQDTYKFNDIASQFDDVDYDSINRQLSYVFEELTETIDGFEQKDSVALLDGICDILVTAFGLAQKLSVAGYDVDEAMKRVCSNNLEKYPKVGSPLNYNASFKTTWNDKYNVWILKDESGKIRKFKDFRSVDLSDLVPKEFFKEAIP